MNAIFTTCTLWTATQVGANRKLLRKYQYSLPCLNRAWDSTSQSMAKRWYRWRDNGVGVRAEYLAALLKVAWHKSSWHIQWEYKHAWRLHRNNSRAMALCLTSRIVAKSSSDGQKQNLQSTIDLQFSLISSTLAAWMHAVIKIYALHVENVHDWPHCDLVHIPDIWRTHV